MARANIKATIDTIRMIMTIMEGIMVTDATGDRMIMAGTINMVTTEINMIQIMIGTQLLWAEELMVEDKEDQVDMMTTMIANTIKIRMTSRRTIIRMKKVKIARATRSKCTSHGFQQN